MRTSASASLAPPALAQDALEGARAMSASASASLAPPASQDALEVFEFALADVLASLGVDDIGAILPLMDSVQQAVGRTSGRTSLRRSFMDKVTSCEVALELAKAIVDLGPPAETSDVAQAESVLPRAVEQVAPAGSDESTEEDAKSTESIAVAQLNLKKGGAATGKEAEAVIPIGEKALLIRGSTADMTGVALAAYGKPNASASITRSGRKTDPSASVDVDAEKAVLSEALKELLREAQVTDAYGADARLQSDKAELQKLGRAARGGSSEACLLRARISACEAVLELHARIADLASEAKKLEEVLLFARAQAAADKLSDGKGGSLVQPRVQLATSADVEAVDVSAIAPKLRDHPYLRAPVSKGSDDLFDDDPEILAFALAELLHEAEVDSIDEVKDKLELSRTLLHSIDLAGMRGSEQAEKIRSSVNCCTAAIDMHRQLCESFSRQTAHATERGALRRRSWECKAHGISLDPSVKVPNAFWNEPRKRGKQGVARLNKAEIALEAERKELYHLENIGHGDTSAAHRLRKRIATHETALHISRLTFPWCHSHDVGAADANSARVDVEPRDAPLVWSTEEAFSPRQASEATALGHLRAEVEHLEGVGLGDCSEAHRNRAKVAASVALDIERLLLPRERWRPNEVYSRNTGSGDGGQARGKDGVPLGEGSGDAHGTHTIMAHMHMHQHLHRGLEDDRTELQHYIETGDAATSAADRLRARIHACETAVYMQRLMLPREQWQTGSEKVHSALARPERPLELPIDKPREASQPYGEDPMLPHRTPLGKTLASVAALEVHDPHIAMLEEDRNDLENYEDAGHDNTIEAHLTGARYVADSFKLDVEGLLLPREKWFSNDVSAVPPKISQDVISSDSKTEDIDDALAGGVGALPSLAMRGEGPSLRAESVKIADHMKMQQTVQDRLDDDRATLYHFEVKGESSTSEVERVRASVAASEAALHVHRHMQPQPEWFPVEAADSDKVAPDPTPIEAIAAKGVKAEDAAQA